MKYYDFSKDIETMRLEGKECLSWIERFGTYLLENSLYEGEPEKNDNILVIRMKDNLLNAYYCYYFTNHEGKTQFTVQDYKEEIDNNPLCEILNNASWDKEATKAWWSEVFAHNDMSILDDSLLGNEMIHVSAESSMKMTAFCEKLREQIENGLIQLWSGKNYTISKIFLAGDYATALPLCYSLSKTYKTTVDMFEADQNKDYYDQDITMMDVARWFYIPWKFRNMQLNISPAMTLEQVAATSGISIPIPVTVFDKNTKKIKDVKLTDKPIAGYEDLDWKDLISDDGCADLQLDEYFFKDIKLCVIPDGYGGYYIGNANDRICRIKLNR